MTASRDGQPSQHSTVAELVQATGLPPDTALDAALAELLSWHVRRPLTQAGITTLQQLAEHPDLLQIPKFGEGRLGKLRDALHTLARATTGQDHCG